jgi:citrate lyase beta subunit
MSLVRSILSVPGHQAAMVEGARSRGADRIAWDLEDSVPLDRKEEARERVAVCVTRDDMVRVNAGDLADVLAVRDLTGWINLPKVESAEAIMALQSLAPGVKVLAVIESPRAVLEADSICRAADAVAFGRADFCAAAGLLRQDAALVAHAMGQIALAALAAGIPAYDSPCETLDLGDMLGEVGRALAYGFAGKICIHPGQLAACRRFEPSTAMRGEAREIAAWRGSGARQHHGRLLAEPHYRLAERIA